MWLPEKHIAFLDNFFGADVADDPVYLDWDLGRNSLAQF